MDVREELSMGISDTLLGEWVRRLNVRVKPRTAPRRGADKRRA
ncbi:MAG: hypothetical protein QOK44_819, partial [Betaproteobacteria bacterium]|nr:hypothetical protein [Betaproteobacteria bacterium]